MKRSGASSSKLFALVRAGTLHRRPGGKLVVLDLGETRDVRGESDSLPAPDSVNPKTTGRAGHVSGATSTYS